MDSDIKGVIIRALVVSQYRKAVASDAHITIKPVILFKSKRTSESKKNFDEFNYLVQELTEADIRKQFDVIQNDDDNSIWNRAKEYYLGKSSGDSAKIDRVDELVGSIQQDFGEYEGADANQIKVLLHDGSNKRLPEQPKLLSTLEEGDNQVRAIFAVNMLQEGWDVLNLFDIVRLYNDRDGKWEDGDYKPGATTTSEVQLIGRGARYYPFEYKGMDKYRRKFDGEPDNKLCVIEQMHYHCEHNPKYLEELKSALEHAGVLPTRDFYVLNMKKEHTDGKSNFLKKSVFENRRVSKKEIADMEHERTLSMLPEFHVHNVMNVRNGSDATFTEKIFFNHDGTIETESETDKGQGAGDKAEDADSMGHGAADRAGDANSMGQDADRKAERVDSKIEGAANKEGEADSKGQGASIKTKGAANGAERADNKTGSADKKAEGADGRAEGTDSMTRGDNSNGRGDGGTKQKADDKKAKAQDAFNCTLIEIAPKNVIHAAVNTIRDCTFEKLHKAYPGLETMNQFLECAGQRLLHVSGAKSVEDVSRESAFEIAKEVLLAELALINHEAEHMYGTKVFYRKSVEKKFSKKITRKKGDKAKEQEFDFVGKDWYVYDKNYGTQDELDFVEWFSNELMTIGADGRTAMAQNGWADVFLARNEGSVKIYKIDDGSGFEPVYDEGQC